MELADRLKRENGDQKIWPPDLDRALSATTAAKEEFIAPASNMKKRAAQDPD